MPLSFDSERYDMSTEPKLPPMPIIPGVKHWDLIREWGLQCFEVGRLAEAQRRGREIAAGIAECVRRGEEMDPTNTLPPLPEPYDRWSEPSFTADQMLAYGDARATHAVAQHPHALKEKIRSAESRIAELEAQIKAREVADAEIDALLQALIWREQFEPRQGEDSNERFERIGKNFYRETGFLRPGKDCVLHSCEERQAAWDAWMNAGRERVRAAIALANGRGVA